MKKIIFYLILLFILLPSWVFAAPLADCNKTTIETAIADTTTYPNGSTIELPSGTCSWSGAVTLDRALTIKGQTTTSRNASTYLVTATDSTIIQKNGFNVTATSDWRVTGITFDFNVADPAGQVFTVPTSLTNVRIDHNHFKNTAKIWNKTGGGGYLNILFDNNRILQLGYEGIYVVGNGNSSWSAGGNCGSSSPERTTWIEDNYFVLESDTNENPIDMGEGARVSIRGNRFDGSPTGHQNQYPIEAHEHCWTYRDGNDNAGMYCLEVSDNKFNDYSNTNAGGVIVKPRGGKTLVYNNSVTGSNWITSGGVYFYTDEGRDPSPCNNTTPCAVQAHEDAGIHAVPLSDDANFSLDSNGYYYCDTWPCPMQVNDSYVWGNSWDSGTFAVINTGATINELSRDWWDDVSAGHTTFTKDVSGSRNGSSCTAGEVYWETNNKKLYRCTATNTWTEKFTAYTYPHPLRGETTAPTYIQWKLN